MSDGFLRISSFSVPFQFVSCLLELHSHDVVGYFFLLHSLLYLIVLELLIGIDGSQN